MSSKKNGECPGGMIERKGYTARRGNKVIKFPSTCIKATSFTGTKRTPIDKEKIATREKIQKTVAKKYGHLDCPPGTIERAGFTKKSYERRSYVRKSGSTVKAAKVGSAEVPPTCVPDKGTIGKGNKLPVVLIKGDLKSAGYDDVKHLTIDERHKALDKANKRIGNSLSLFRKLVMISTLNKNQDPKLAKIFKDDAYWIRDTYGLMRTKPKTSNNKKYSGSKTNNKK